jgi:hypothetical protein
MNAWRSSLAGTPANCCVGNAEGQVNYNSGHTSSCCTGRGSIVNGVGRMNEIVGTSEWAKIACKC